MDFSKRVRKWVHFLTTCILLIGCNSTTVQLSDEIIQTGITPIQTETITPAGPTPSPTSCTGWPCEITGIVYMDSAEPVNALEGVQVNLSQISWCSPTAGEQETRSNPKGAFVFEVYLHDTDSFNIQVDHEGYQIEKVKFGGFDCLYCICPPIEIVLQTAQ